MSKTSKEKEINVLAIVCACVCLLPLFYGVYFYQNLPSEIPTSFGFDGKIRGTTQKEIFVFAFPLIMALGTLFLHFMVNADPKNRHQDKKMMMVSKWIMPLFINIFYPLSIYIALGNAVNTVVVVGVVLGILLIFYGNYLPKTNRSFTIGIKLPWTLQSESNWRKTNKLAGVIYVVFGFLFIMSSFMSAVFFAILILFMLANFYLIYYSYSMYCKEVEK